MDPIRSFAGDLVTSRGHLLPVDFDILRRLDEEMKNIVGYDEALFITGADNEAGFNQYNDRITQTLDGADLNAMWREFQSAIALLNRQRDPLVNLLSYRISKPVERVMYPTDHDFEEASEFGEPKGIRLGAPFTLGFDFKWYDLAIRYTWMFLSEASSDQLVALNSSALEASVRLQFTKVLSALFKNTNRTTTINDGQTALNVYPLWNAGGGGAVDVPPSYKGRTFDNTHNHYLASGGTTVDAGDLQAMEATMTEHGYRITEGYRFLLLVNQQEGATIRTFVAGSGGALYSFIPSSNVGGGVFLPANGGIVGAPALVTPAGLTVIGTYGPWVIVEEDYVPAGYMVGLASAGEQNLGNLVGIREHERSNLRGLQLVQGKDFEYPLIDSYYIQGLGTGIRHRGAAVVTKITSGSYTVPTAYA